MQRTYTSGIRRGSAREVQDPLDSHDYSISRCKTERLAEQMSIEKATSLLRIPQGRANAATDRRVIDNCFMDRVNQRVKVAPGDPDYLTKIENRHVLELLIHESYQFMTKYAKEQVEGGEKESQGDVAAATTTESGLLGNDEMIKLGQVGKNSDGGGEDVGDGGCEDARSTTSSEDLRRRRKKKHKPSSPFVERLIQEYWIAEQEESSEEHRLLGQGRPLFVDPEQGASLRKNMAAQTLIKRDWSFLFE